MLKKRIIITLTFLEGVLFRTKKFIPDYRYTKNFIDLWSIDELILIDISEKKFSKEFCNTVIFFSSNCHVPITVGGGIKNIDNVDLYFKLGADKVVLGTQSLDKTNLIKDISRKYGNQSIIQSIDCIKEKNSNNYNVMKNNGKFFYSNDIIHQCKKALSNGAGEILINNIDNDGSLLGYDLNLIEMVSNKINCPILALGGAGNWKHILDLFSKTNISGACTQNIFHFTEESILSAKKFLRSNKIKIRN
ncbi:HisA/HisF-related TIM barrel protein [Candidatus Pelagibacter sp.]|nr:HisA/HisF-related TIM barrel protein [Candidatus Pelagibacter sp.]